MDWKIERARRPDLPGNPCQATLTVGGIEFCALDVIPGPGPGSGQQTSILTATDAELIAWAEREQRARTPPPS